MSSSQNRPESGKALVTDTEQPKKHQSTPAVPSLALNGITRSTDSDDGRLQRRRHSPRDDVPHIATEDTIETALKAKAAGSPTHAAAQLAAGRLSQDTFGRPLRQQLLQSDSEHESFASRYTATTATAAIWTEYVSELV